MNIRTFYTRIHFQFWEKNSTLFGRVDIRGGREASVEDFDHLERGRPSVEDFDVEVFDVRDFDSSPPVRTIKKSVENFDRKKNKTEKQIGVENFY